MVNALYRVATVLLLLVFVTAGLSSCQRSKSKPSEGEPSTAQLSPEQKAKTEFDRDLQFIRNGRFSYIWVFSRSDGKPLDKDDGDYLRKNAPQVIDWATTDGGRKVIAGTNFDLELGNLALLRKRFIAENFSGK